MDLSIIIPAYNCIDTIERTIESISIQKLSISFETIVVNDCSDYDYSKVIDKYKDRLNIREIKTPKNGGPGVARQYGIDNSSSTYITFIDGDDYFYDDMGANGKTSGNYTILDEADQKTYNDYINTHPDCGYKNDSATDKANWRRYQVDLLIILLK